MRSFLYPIIGCLIGISSTTQSVGSNGTNNLCDPPLVLSTTICDGETATRNVQNVDPDATYSWYADAAHTNLLGNGTSFITPALHATTQYYIEAVIGSCSAASTFTVTVNTLILPIVKNDTICENYDADGHLYILNPQPGYIYNWYKIPEGFVGTGVSYTFPFAIPLYSFNSFYVEAVNGNCISEHVDAKIIYWFIPAPSVNRDTICQGNTSTLSVMNLNNGYTYSWYDAPDLSRLIHVGIIFTTQPLNATTTFYVKSDYKACTSTWQTVVVDVKVVTPPTAKDVGICPGNSAYLSVQNPSAGYTYNWYASPNSSNVLATGTSFTTPVLNSTATYYVDVFDSECRSLPTAVNAIVFAPDSPRLTVTNITGSSLSFSWPAIAGAVGYQVSVNGGAYISPSSGAMGTTHTVSGLAQEQTVTIAVVALSPPGCANGYPGHATGTTYGLGFYVPSAFTPNSDHLNDIIKPKLPGGSVLDYFTIYNRWGQRIFSTTTIGKGWDGKFQGIDQSPGTYVWICRYHFASGQPLNEKGAFTLLY